MIPYIDWTLRASDATVKLTRGGKWVPSSEWVYFMLFYQSKEKCLSLKKKTSDKGDTFTTEKRHWTDFKLMDSYRAHTRWVVDMSTDTHDWPLSMFLLKCPLRHQQMWQLCSQFCLLLFSFFIKLIIRQDPHFNWLWVQRQQNQFEIL